MPKYIIETDMSQSEIIDLLSNALDGTELVSDNNTDFTVTPVPETASSETQYPEILELLKDFKHCGDYGNAFYRPATKSVWLTLGDADGDVEEGYSSFFEYREKLLQLDYVDEVEFEAEADPFYEGDDPEGWILVGEFGVEHYSPETQAWLDSLRKERG